MQGQKLSHIFGLIAVLFTGFKIVVVVKDQNLESFHSVTRFNNRVRNYSKYRPDYPEFIFPFFEKEFDLKIDMLFADVGSGTGLFSNHLLKRGYNLVCVEPNKEMRQYSFEKFSFSKSFKIVNGTGEKTHIDSQSIDCIFVAQAFHWMDAAKVKLEFDRILKPGGKICILWILPSKLSDFTSKYENLRQKFAVNNYPTVRNDENILKQFFEPKLMGKKVFYFSTLLDFTSLKGLLLSASFIPQEDHPQYRNMIDSLTQLFDESKVNNTIEIEYQLPIYWNI